MSGRCVETSPQPPKAAPPTATSATSSTATTAVARMISSSTTIAPTATATAIPKRHDTTDEGSRESTGSTIPKDAPTKSGSRTSTQYITEPGPDDVLLGRGAPIINYVGNVKFRSLVRSRKNDCITSGRHKIKDKVAKSILKEIQRRGGRFLKRIEVSKTALVDQSRRHAQHATTTATTAGDSSTSQLQARAQTQAQHQPEMKVYQIADYDIALEKVKQALRDKDTEQQHQHHYQQPQPQPQQQETTKTAVSQFGLEEAAAASGIATLTALQQQLYDRMGNTATARSDVSVHPASSSSNHSSVPSINFLQNHKDDLTPAPEFMRYQQLQSLLPMKLQERLINNERINLLNQQLQQQQRQQQDQQRLLAMLGQSSNIVINKHSHNNESYQLPFSQEMVMSLLQRTTNPLMQNTDRIDRSIDVEGYLLLQQQQQQQQQRSSDLMSVFGNSNTKNLSTRDLFALQQQPSVGSVQNSSSVFSSDNRLSETTANLLVQRQYDQYRAALLAHSVSLNETRKTPNNTNNNCSDITSRIVPNHIPDNVLLSNNVLGEPLLSDSIASIRSTSGKNVSETIPLLTGGKIGEHSETTLTSMVSLENMKKKKRKWKMNPVNASPKSNVTGDTKQINPTSKDEIIDNVNPKKTRLE